MLWSSLSCFSVGIRNKAIGNTLIKLLLRSIIVGLCSGIFRNVSKMGIALSSLALRSRAMSTYIFSSSCSYFDFSFWGVTEYSERAELSFIGLNMKTDFPVIAPALKMGVVSAEGLGGLDVYKAMFTKGCPLSWEGTLLFSTLVQFKVVLTRSLSLLLAWLLLGNSRVLLISNDSSDTSPSSSSSDCKMTPALFRIFCAATSTKLPFFLPFWMSFPLSTF